MTAADRAFLSGVITGAPFALVAFTVAFALRFDGAAWWVVLARVVTP